MALAIGCAVIGSGWSSGANGATPAVTFAHPATNPALGSASRIFAASAGDATGQRTVLYGGEAPGTSDAYADTWVNEADGSWKPECGTTVSGATAACGPGPRDGLGMAGAAGGVVLYGGFPSDIGGDGNPPTGDTWRWNGLHWSEVCSTTTCGPGARGLMAMAGNGTTAVMYGGLGQSGALSDTWVFDGSTWTQTCGQPGTPCGPAPVAGASMAWDGKNFVLFGGADLNGNGTPVDDTWIFNGTDWTHACGTSVGRPCGPGARDLAAFAFVNSPDPALRGAMLAEGGNLFGNGTQSLDRDAWFFDGTHWTQLDPPWNGPPVSWSNNGSPPAGPNPILGVMAAKPALCEAVYLGTSVTTSGNPPTLREGTYFAGRYLWDRDEPSCQAAVDPPHPTLPDPDPIAGPGVVPVTSPAPAATPPTTAPAPDTDAPTLAMTGASSVGVQTATGFVLVALGFALLLATDSRRRSRLP